MVVGDFSLTGFTSVGSLRACCFLFGLVFFCRGVICLWLEIFDVVQVFGVFDSCLGVGVCGCGWVCFGFSCWLCVVVCWCSEVVVFLVAGWVWFGFLER